MSSWTCILKRYRGGNVLRQENTYRSAVVADRVFRTATASDLRFTTEGLFSEACSELVEGVRMRGKDGKSVRFSS